jgi:hypothetical protein
MKARWGDGLRSDPYYNPLFDIDGQPFFDLVDPEIISSQAYWSRWAAAAKDPPARSAVVGAASQARGKSRTQGT